MRCPSCAAPLPAGSRACSDCRSAPAGEESLGVSIVAIEGLLAPPTPPRATAVSTSVAARVASPGAAPRFAPGEVVAGRYRVVERVGSGGMGEVWRADDLNLGEPVALKFLPRELAQDRFWLARLRGEVHAAHAVTHPHVCRVHDIVEVEGSPCLSMEYVDGEDLASLLVRIRPVPEDKAIEIARAICSGLAAAHRQGILHRDLKPSNIMLDKRGEVRLTDFGLAVDLREGAVAPSNAGTPRTWRPSSSRASRRACRATCTRWGSCSTSSSPARGPFQGATMAAMQRARTRARLAPPSALAPRIDPLVERAILACLGVRSRPASGLGLVGRGDAAGRRSAVDAARRRRDALAGAGRLRGRQRGLAPAVAWTLFAVVIACGAAIAWLNRGAHMLRYVDLRLPPQVLEDRARELLGRVLPGRGALDSAAGFDFDPACDRARRERRRVARGRARTLGPARVRVQPGRLLLVSRESAVAGAAGRLRTRDARGPAADAEARRSSGSRRAAGCSRSRTACPGGRPRRRRRRTSTGRRSSRRPGSSARASRASSRAGCSARPADLCVAWRSRSADAGALHVEAAALRGRPVGFRVFEAWELDAGGAAAGAAAPPSSWGGEPAVPPDVPGDLRRRVLGAAQSRARARGSGRRDAHRGGVPALADAGLAAARAPRARRDARARAAVPRSCAGAAGRGDLWLIYLALEPYVRRIWPDSMISWNRLLAGKWRDPLVGADVLVGLTVSTLAALVDRAQFHLASAGAPRPAADLVLARRAAGFPRAGRGDAVRAGRLDARRDEHAVRARVAAPLAAQPAARGRCPRGGAPARDPGDVCATRASGSRSSAARCSSASRSR
jgi:serine/threonine-protein kinase